jgi:phosphotransacetylase
LPENQHPARDRIDALIERAAALPALAVAVAHPCSPEAIAGAVAAAERGLIHPVLVGPAHKIRAAAADAGVQLNRFELVEAPHSHAAADIAVALARAGKVEALMKGSLHTDELLHAALSTVAGLRTERRASHVYLLDVPAYDRLLLMSDAAVNIAPTLLEKADICANAIDLARAIGIVTPRVAILSAVETVTPRIPSTIDAAALCKMAERGQIEGGIVDGPLAFDNAVDPQAAATKGIVSPVVGRADILLVPDLESGNMLAKQLILFAGADAAGLVVGLRVPLMLTSRADGARARLASCALALLARRGPP